WTLVLNIHQCILYLVYEQLSMKLILLSGMS
ncbi:unnamed protein product, partial [Rotaria sp. Silwood1]